MVQWCRLGPPYPTGPSRCRLLLRGQVRHEESYRLGAHGGHAPGGFPLARHHAATAGPVVQRNPEALLQRGGPHLAPFPVLVSAAQSSAIKNCFRWFVRLWGGRQWARSLYLCGLRAFHLFGHRREGQRRRVLEGPGNETLLARPAARTTSGWEKPWSCGFSSSMRTTGHTWWRSRARARVARSGRGSSSTSQSFYMTPTADEG